MALNILFGRPIYSFGSSQQLSHQTDILPPSDDVRRQYPVNILFNVNHFMGLLGIPNRTLLPLPPMVTSRFWQFEMQSYTVC